MLISRILTPHNYIPTYLLVIEPRHERELHGGHEDVSLDPADVQLLARPVDVSDAAPVAVAADHVGQNKGVAWKIRRNAFYSIKRNKKRCHKK